MHPKQVTSNQLLFGHKFFTTFYIFTFTFYTTFLESFYNILKSFDTHHDPYQATQNSDLRTVTNTREKPLRYKKVNFLQQKSIPKSYPHPWGHTSFWGATVITNLFSKKPLNIENKFKKLYYFKFYNELKKILKILLRSLVIYL